MSASSWNDQTIGDVIRMNRTSIISGTGAYLATLDYTLHKLLHCTSSGSGFTLDHVYLCRTDGSGVDDLGPGSIDSHTHNNGTNGGELIHIWRDNPTTVDLWLTKSDDLKKAQWNETTTGTATIEDKTDGTTGERSIRLRPNATSGSGATVRYPHLKLGFADPSIFICKLQIETASSLALHAGVAADDITAADGNEVKYNAEVCTATNNNWFLRSANGTTNSTSDTGTAMSANRVGIKVTHRPDLGTKEVNMKIDSGSTFQKTSNIPSTGSTLEHNLVKFSIKNNTGADRPLLVYGCRLSYSTSTEWGKP